MDFVVAGLGLGALIVVVGFVVRDLGPLLWRYVSRRSVDSESTARALWGGLCQSISMVLTIAGVVILVATVVAVALGLSDHLGSRIVIIVSVAAVLAAGVLLTLNVRDYRAEIGLLSSAESGLGRSSSRQFSTSLTTSVTTNPIASARPNRKSEELATASHALNETGLRLPEHDPHLDQPFDATKLLASEFDHHHEADESGTKVAGAPEEQQVFPEVVELAEVEDTTLVPVQVASTESRDEAVSDQQMSVNLQVVKSAPVEDTVVSSVFRSPLLADIGVAAEPAVNGFESSLLADVELSTDDQATEFVSPLLADLAVLDPDVVDDSNEAEKSENTSSSDEQAEQPAGRKR